MPSRCLKDFAATSRGLCLASLVPKSLLLMTILILGQTLSSSIPLLSTPFSQNFDECQVFDSYEGEFTFTNLCAGLEKSGIFSASCFDF